MSQEQREQIALTDRLVSVLRREIKRTGIGKVALCRLLGQRSSGPTSSMIEAWLRGRAKTVKKSHIDFVLAELTKLPDDPSSAREHLTEEALSQLRALFAQTGIGPRPLLQGAPDLPEGLTERIVYAWLYRNTKTARKDHLDYVLSRLKTLSERPETKPPIRQSAQVPRRSAEAGLSEKPRDKSPEGRIKPGYRLDELHNNIRAIRLSQDMSPDDLAHACGVTRGTVNGWEIRKEPLKPETTARIAEALGCKPSDLIQSPPENKSVQNARV